MKTGRGRKSLRGGEVSRATGLAGSEADEAGRE